MPTCFTCDILLQSRQANRRNAEKTAIRPNASRLAPLKQTNTRPAKSIVQKSVIPVTSRLISLQSVCRLSLPFSRQKGQSGQEPAAKPAAPRGAEGGARLRAGHCTPWTLRGSSLPGIAAVAARSHRRTPVPRSSDTKRRGSGTGRTPGGSPACSRSSDNLIPGISVTFTRTSRPLRNFVRSREAGEQRVKEQRALPGGEGLTLPHLPPPRGIRRVPLTRSRTPSAACVGSLGVCFGPDQRCSRKITRPELFVLP